MTTMDLGDLHVMVVRRVMQDNAATLYKVPLPAPVGR
jgi:hypothetical protein